MPNRLTGCRFACPLALTAGVLAVTVCPCPAWANLGGALSGGAGIDYQAGPRSQSYRDALLFVSTEGTPGDVTVAAIRYDDSVAGAGTAGFASAGVGIASALKLRVIGLHTFGDHGFDAWRLRAGPELDLASDVTLGAYYVRLHDDSPESFDAGGLEVTIPVTPSLSAQAGTSYGTWSNGATTAQGTLAGTLRAGKSIQLLCEVDVGRNIVTTSSSSSATGGGIVGGLPLPGGLGNGTPAGTQTQTDRSITSTAQLGVRFLIP